MPESDKKLLTLLEVVKERLKEIEDKRKKAEEDKLQGQLDIFK